MIEPRWIVYDPAPDQEEDPPIIGAEHAKWGILYRARAYAQTAIEMRADELTEGAVIIKIDASIPVLAEIVEEAIQQEYLHDERAPAIMEVLGTVLVSYLTREVGTLIQQAEHWAPTHPLATHHRINKADAYQQIIYKMENGGFSAMFEEAQRPAVHEPGVYPPNPEIAGLRDARTAADAYWAGLPEAGEAGVESEEDKLRRTLADVVAQIKGSNFGYTHGKRGGGWLRDKEVWARAQALVEGLG